MVKKCHDPPVGLVTSTTIAAPTVTGSRRKERSRRSKTKFRCGFCGQACWAKPAATIVCGKCGIKMLPVEASS